MNRKLHILIVIYTYNNGATLPAVVQTAMTTGYDLLIIDDGSEDGSLETIAEYPCRCIRLNKHNGLGTALLLGMDHANKLGYNTLAALDADGRYNPENIHLLIERAKTCQSPCLVIGAPRPTEEGSGRSQQRTNSVDFWTRLECGLELPDVESTFRLYPVQEMLAQHLAANRQGFLRESIVKLAWSGIPVFSVPVPAGKISGEKPKHLTDTLGTFALHGRLLFRRLLPWPHKKLIEEEQFQKKIAATLTKNPLKVLGQLCREHTSPLWLAIAVWLGIFMGALPLLAIHTIAIIYVAHRLHLNKVAAVAASQFCMPPVVPVLCIQTGYFLRHGELLFDFSWQPWLLGIHERLWEWLIGSLLVGPLFGLIGAIGMYLAASRLQNRMSKGIDQHPF